MKIKGKIRLGSCLIPGILLFVSCTERIDIPLDTSFTRLVVEGSITTDTMAHEVRLARTAAYFNAAAPVPVSGAQVYITDSSRQFQLSENPVEPGLYETEPGVFGMPGHTYTLHIQNVDLNNDGKLEEFSASSYLPPLHHPDSIKVEYVSRFFQHVWEVRFFGQDIADQRNFYLFRVRKNGQLVTDTIKGLHVSSDDYYNGAYIKGEPIAILRQGRANEQLSSGDTVTLETYAITEDYYNFILDVYMESRGSDPFGGQPANISTNLTNKAIGYFTAMSVARNSNTWRKQ